MDAIKDGPAPARNGTAIERTSARDLVVTRRFNSPVRPVYAAWTRSDLFVQWWVPRSMAVPLLSCEMDVRNKGTYRLVFGADAASAMAFFGSYLEVVPEVRLVWTNEESAEGPVTTVTFADEGATTLLTLHERHPTKEVLDLSIEGMEGAMPEQFAQLDDLLARLGTSA